MVSRVAPCHGFAALGGVCVALGAGHLVFAGGGLATLLEFALVFPLAAVGLYTAVDVARWDLSRAGEWRAVRICAAVILFFSVLAVIIWTIWWFEHQAFKFSFLVSFAASLGAAVGSRGGLYVVKADEKLTEAQELTTLLSISDRVLRHNIRTELSVALGTLDGIETVADADELADRAETARCHLKDLAETSDRTRRIASIWRTDARYPLALAGVVNERVAQLIANDPDADIRTEVADDCVVQAHPAVPLAIEEALRNAVDHTPDGVAVTVRVWEAADGTHCVDIEDTGQGIPPKEREALENAEETPLAHTEGLGLWMIYWTVTRSGGTVEFADNEPTGTVVRIRIPVQRDAGPISGGSASPTAGFAERD
jgi:signal transduction histidine kinase